MYVFPPTYSDRKAGAYADRDIVLTLPSTISATDLKWLSMFCVDYSHDFGNVKFPSELNVPPHMGEISECVFYYQSFFKSLMSS